MVQRALLWVGVLTSPYWLKRRRETEQKEGKEGERAPETEQQRDREKIEEIELVRIYAHLHPCDTEEF
jgi:hypothetical protein